MKQRISTLLVLFLFLPSIAIAHTGIDQTAGFLHGLAHPIGGADHLLAMLAVGIWAAQIGGQALWRVTGTFIAVMLLGGLLGLTNIPLPFVEEGILVSILVLGILITSAFKLPLMYSCLVVGVFAIFHGYAHGSEMPTSMSAVAYALGFSLATAVLHLSGIALAVLVKKTKAQFFSRFAGGTIALCGGYLASQATFY